MKLSAVIFYLSVALVLLTSCAPTQQIVGINSASVKMNEQQIFQYANEDLEMQYFFNGYQIPIRLRIENKRNEPLVINLSNSFLIVQNRSLPWSSSPEHRLVIPPRSFDEIRGFRVITNRLEYLDYETIIHGKFSNHAKYSQVYFNPFNSPYEFRNYLTYGLGLQPKEWKSLDHPFYVHEIIEVKGEMETKDLSTPNFGVVDYQQASNSGAGLFSILILTGIFLLLIA
jgi:hypothetical protein